MPAHNESIRCQTVEVPLACDGQRLDQTVAALFSGLSRTAARKIITIGGTWINNQRVQVQGRTVRAGDRISVYTGRHPPHKRYETDPHRILHEDSCLLAYNKEAGVPTQGIVCDNYNNVYSALQRYQRTHARRWYVGLHHRLDIDTTGVLLCTVAPTANRNLHRQFTTRQVDKRYLAVTDGRFNDTCRRVEGYISRRNSRYCFTPDPPGRYAATTFRLRHHIGPHSLVEATLHTGRTHQIRLQLAWLGIPVLGDPRYGNGLTANAARTLLHAWQLSLRHPVSGQPLTIEAPPPDDMQPFIAPSDTASPPGADHTRT